MFPSWLVVYLQQMLRKKIFISSKFVVLFIVAALLHVALLRHKAKLFC